MLVVINVYEHLSMLYLCDYIYYLSLSLFICLSIIDKLTTFPVWSFNNNICIQGILKQYASEQWTLPVAFLYCIAFLQVKFDILRNHIYICVIPYFQGMLFYFIIKKNLYLTTEEK